ncbi:unnamed protein product, partial [Closterium sp. Naga37s-1]
VASLTLSARRAEANSVSAGGYTVFSNNTIFDSSGAAVTTTKNGDGSQSVGGYTLYTNGTFAGPDGPVYGLRSDRGLLIGSTVVYTNGTYADASGKPVQPVPNSDGSGATAGDLTVFTNGTMVSSKGVIVHTTDMTSKTSGKAASASSIKL